MEGFLGFVRELDTVHERPSPYPMVSSAETYKTNLELPNLRQGRSQSEAADALK